MTSKIFCTLLQVMLVSVIAVHAVPAKYCFYPLNRTDCGMAPTPVFSYYKSGSRCEVEIWRGCPSYNRFDSMTSCTHYCIARMNFEENEIPDDESCEGKLNNADCGAKVTTVYTFDSKTETCLEAEWRGCKTSNKFDTVTECRNQCMPNQSDKWKDTIEKMSKQDINDMNKLVDEILNEPYEKLKNVQHKPQIEATTTEELVQDDTEDPEAMTPATTEATTETVSGPDEVESVI